MADRFAFRGGDRSKGLLTRRARQERHDARTLPRLRALAALGLSNREIAKLLSLDGYPPPSGKGKWNHVAVWRMRRRHREGAKG